MSQSFNELLARAAAAADPRITPERASAPPSVDGSFSGFSEPAVSSSMARLLAPHFSESEESVPAQPPVEQVVQDSPASPAESQKAGFTVRTVYSDGSHGLAKTHVQVAPPVRRLDDRENDPNLQTIPRLRKPPRQREDGHVSMQTLMPAVCSYERPATSIPQRHVVYVPETPPSRPRRGVGAASHHPQASFGDHTTWLDLEHHIKLSSIQSRLKMRKNYGS